MINDSSNGMLTGSVPAAHSESHSLYAVFRGQWSLQSPFLKTAEGETWDYNDLDLLTARISKQLQSAGLRHGDRLISQLERSAWNIFLYLGCLRAGIVYIPLNPKATPPELEHIARDVEPHAIVCNPDLLGTIHETLKTLDTQPRMLTLDTSGAGTLTSQNIDSGILPDHPVAPDDIAAIVFTSGTTGRPKGAVLPHSLLVEKARALSQTLHYRATDRLLHTMPLYHAHGLFMTTHCVLSSGASMLLLPRFDAGEVIRHLPEVTIFSGVSTMYKRMLGRPDLRVCAQGMRLFIAGSAAVPPDIFEQFAQQSGHQIVECWGMSETMTNTANPVNGPRKPGSAGKPLPGVELKVFDAQGRPAAAHTPGILSVRSTTRFPGYWRRGPAEQPTYHDGFYLTGDIGYQDSEGYLFIVGRVGDVIVSGGYNVYPREVELALEHVEGVARAAVFGLPHPDLGEAVAAAVETTDPYPDPAEIIKQARKSIVGYKAPKALFIVDQLPLTELGKVRRRTLIERFRNHFLHEQQAPA